MSRRSFLILIAVASVMAFGFAGAFIAVKFRAPAVQATVPGQIVVSPDVTIGGPFTLTDQNGKRVTDGDFRGRFMLLYFGYTYCPDVCPTELNTMALALDQLGIRARIVPVFVTVDPERDTPDQLKSYLASFGSDFVGLTGGADDIAQVAKAYRVYYKKAEVEGGDYLMDHTSLIYLVGPDGKLKALFRTGTSPEDLAQGIKATFAGAEK